MNGAVYTRKAWQYLEAVHIETSARAPVDNARCVRDLVRTHEIWRGELCLNMNPAEGLMSRAARELLASDLATRLTEGLPGDKLYPHGRQNHIIDEIEATAISLARRLFDARFVEWRPSSNSMANAAVFFALLEPGDLVLVQDEEGGGNYSYHAHGPLGLRGAQIVPLPPRDPSFEIDIDRAAQQISQLRPKMIVIGGGKVLFPYPVAALRALADAVGALLVYDAAHLGLHISAGEFQRPLEEGAHIVTLSTHKVMGGPVGGLVLTNHARIARRVSGLVFPGLLQTRDLNKYAALAVSLAENVQFGGELARRMVANARALAAQLCAQGFDVIARERRFTQTHQLFLDLGTAAGEFEARCHDANILVSDCALTGDLARGRRCGARIATHELTRYGMGEPEMAQIARMMADAFHARRDAASLREQVAALRARFPTILYSFDEHGT